MGVPDPRRREDLGSNPSQYKLLLPRGECKRAIPPFAKLLLSLFQCTQVESLSLSGELMTEAQRWAEHLASVGALKHSNIKYRGEPVGENVAAKTGSRQVDYTGQSCVSNLNNCLQ